MSPHGGGGGGWHKLEFLQFKFCAKILYAIRSVFLRICAGVRWALQAPTVCHEQLLGTKSILFAHCSEVAQILLRQNL